MMFEVYIGCEEWQDITQFNTQAEAQIYVNGHSLNMGLYPATDGWIENLSTGEKDIFLAECEKP